MTAPYTSYDTHRRLYRYQRPVPRSLQQFFRSKVQREWLGGDKSAAAERARNLAFYHDGVFRRLTTASPAEQAMVREHKWEGLVAAGKAVEFFDRYPTPLQSPREAAQRLANYRGSATIASHEGLSLATVAGQALMQDDMRRFEAETRDCAALATKIAPALVADSEGLDALHSLWIKSFGSNPPKRTSDNKASLDLFVAFMGKATRWLDIRNEDAKRWRDAMEQESLSPRRIKNHLKALSAMWAGAISKTYGTEAEGKVNPFHKVSPTGWKKVSKTEQRERGKTFRPEWTKALLAKAIDPEKPWGAKRHALVMDAWNVFRRTGARVMEATSIQRGDLIEGPDGKPALRITCIDAGKRHKVRHPEKGDKTVESDRTLPLHSDLHAWWAANRSDDPARKGEFLFGALPYDAEKGRSIWFSQNFYKLRVKCADVPADRTFNNWRHTYITAIAAAAAKHGFKDKDHEYLTAHGAVTVHKGYQDHAEFAKLRELVESVTVP